MAFLYHYTKINLSFYKEKHSLEKLNLKIQELEERISKQQSPKELEKLKRKLEEKKKQKLLYYPDESAVPEKN